jgi:hypothetical protein
MFIIDKRTFECDKRKKLLKKGGKKESLGCDLGWTWTTICIYKKQGKKIYGWTKIFFFIISNAKNLTCISNNQKCK